MSTEVAADLLRIGSHTLESRLVFGTGKDSSYELMRETPVTAGG